DASDPPQEQLQQSTLATGQFDNSLAATDFAIDFGKLQITGAKDGSRQLFRSSQQRANSSKQLSVIYGFCHKIVGSRIQTTDALIDVAVSSYHKNSHRAVLRTQKSHNFNEIQQLNIYDKQVVPDRLDKGR